jgi:hypothetical protein
MSSNYTITPIPDETDSIIVTPRTESVDYEITDSGKVVDVVPNTAGPDDNTLSKEEIAQRVLQRKANELAFIARVLKQNKRLAIRAAEQSKRKRTNRQKNKTARASRKRNR